jgi:hypothetical protein
MGGCQSRIFTTPPICPLVRIQVPQPILVDTQKINDSEVFGL